MTNHQKRCTFWYHSPTSTMAEQCIKLEGHAGEHEKPQLISAQQVRASWGWINHG